MCHNYRRLGAVLLCLALLCECMTAMSEPQTTDLPQTPSLKESATVIGENFIKYPQLEGLADEALQQTINNTIVERGQIAQRLVSLTTLGDTGLGLQVDYSAKLWNDALSLVIDANGKMTNGRDGQEYTAMTFDLHDGHLLTVDELFTDVSAAVQRMESILSDGYIDDLSAYLASSNILPLPTEQFSLDDDGITFYYQAEDFQLLSGYSGSVQFHYDELADLFKADSLPERISSAAASMDDQAVKAAIVQSVKDGKLPQAPVAIGDAMKDVISAYRLLRTPDQFPGGRYFELESAAFRGIQVLSDALTSSWDSSVVEGIHSKRINLFGLVTGTCTQARWREVLGAPESTVDFSEDLAYNYGLPVGSADYYAIEGRTLRMYADANGMLYSVQLSK